MPQPKPDPEPNRPLSDPTLFALPPDPPPVLVHDREVAPAADGAVAVRIREVAFNRAPDNVLDLETLRHASATIERAVRSTAANHADFVDVLVLRGAAEIGAFARDLAPRDRSLEADAAGSTRAARLLVELHALARTLIDAPFLTIARIDGACEGLGIDLVLACDLALAAADTTFRCTEIELAQVPYLWPALLAPTSARALLPTLLSAAPLNAAHAASLGLVSEVVSAGALDQAIDRHARALATRSPAVARATTIAMRRARFSADGDIAARIAAHEAFILNRVFTLADAAEGPRAALDQRAPEWTERVPPPDLDSPDARLTGP